MNTLLVIKWGETALFGLVGGESNIRNVKSNVTIIALITILFKDHWVNQSVYH